MGLMTHGSPEQKLRAAFRMCDLDNDGCITKWELESVITVSWACLEAGLRSRRSLLFQAIYNTIAPLHNAVGEGKGAAAVASAIFQNLDKNHDEKIRYRLIMLRLSYKD